MDIGGLSLHRSNLALSFRALLQFRHLLTLYGGRGDLLTEDDVTDFAGSK